MPEKVRTVARYLRVSTTDQNPSLQSDGTADLIERRGWVLGETYLDHGVSGSRDSRPALDRMMADARRGKFGILMVWKTDRLFRSLRHLVNTLAELSALGIEFVSVTEPFDSSVPSGKLLLSIVGAMSEFEKSLLQSRTRAGLAAARARGVKIGRPQVHIDEARFLELRAKGLSLSAAARELRVGATTLQRLAKRLDIQGPSKTAPAGP